MDLAKNYDAIKAQNAEIIAVSTDDLAGADYAVENFEAKFPIVYSSNDNAVPKSYGVFNLHGDGLASESIYIYDVSRTLVWKSIGVQYSDTVSSDRLIRALEEINARASQADQTEPSEPDRS
ncbi:MAG: redoxin domain-containing protein [Chloroflexi bacterium]|nr:redoxin domain-containing protein [Chloroflexota bacterium]